VFDRIRVPAPAAMTITAASPRVVIPPAFHLARLCGVIRNTPSTAY
jgi:hypothetical protein